MRLNRRAGRSLHVPMLALRCSLLLALLGCRAAPLADAPPQGPYFPVMPEIFGDLYGPHLRAMGEPALATVESRTERAFRFTWLRTFHRPVAVRVEQHGDSATLTATVLDGQGGYEPGSVAERVRRPLTRDEWQRLAQSIDEAGFWTLELELDIGTDGALWLLEGRRGREYHMVQQWTPMPETSNARFRELCLSLVRLSGLEIEPIY